MNNNRFYIIDKNFKNNKKKYIIQCVMAATAVSCILIFLNALFNAAVLAAFGATCFIVFALPHKNSSKPRLIIGGYLVGIVIGIATRSLIHFITPDYSILWLISVSGALAIALSIFIMTVTNTEHPPAAGVALGIALEGYELLGIGILSIAIIILISIKYLLKRWMIDLV